MEAFSPLFNLQREKHANFVVRFLAVFVSAWSWRKGFVIVRQSKQGNTRSGEWVKLLSACFIILEMLCVIPTVPCETFECMQIRKLHIWSVISLWKICVCWELYEKTDTLTWSQEIVITRNQATLLTNYNKGLCTRLFFGFCSCWPPIKPRPVL